ncbi:MAG: hypothetical protein J6P61_03000 [Erysipelotrichaceae bacterium]|nr:hypothetical protein [Erysipelotrichaceae bacterium]
MRMCLRCKHEMVENCYIQEQGVSISDVVIVEKDEDYKKILHPVKAAYCPKCGYTEFYINVEKSSAEKKAKDDFVSRINRASIMEEID